MRHVRIFFVFIFVFAGCTPSPQPSSAATPLHVLVLQDVSRSVDGLVPRLDPVDFAPVLDAAEARGGTVAFGSFGVVSRPFVHIVFSPPRLATTQPKNVFLRRPEDQDRTVQFRQEYLARSREEREAFHAAVSQLLEESASQTNLVAALARAEVFFSEAPRDARKVMVVVSDLVDTSGTTSFSLSLAPDVQLFLVSHSNREFGLLADQAARFHVFESVPSALQAVVEE